MAEKLFTLAERAALQSLRSEVAAGNKGEVIVDFTPTEPSILTDISLFLHSPNLVSEATATENTPKDEINRLLEQLSEKIQQDQNRTETKNGFVVHAATKSGDHLMVASENMPDGKQAGVKRIIRDHPKRFPYVAVEEYALAENGLFLAKEYIRYSPQKSFRERIAVIYNHPSLIFSQEARERFTMLQEITREYVDDSGML